MPEKIHPHKRLLLLRHAKSDWPAGVADFDRPLAPRGIVAAGQMGAYLAREGLVADLILASPACSTRQTWDIVSACLSAQPKVAFIPSIYEATTADLLAAVRSIGDDVRTLLVIGHNPGLEDLAALLLDDPKSEPARRLAAKYPTCGLAVFELTVPGWGSVGPGLGRLVRFVTPKSLVGG